MFIYFNMNYEHSEEAIEEGRLALLQLEKELIERGNETYNDVVSDNGSKPHSSTNGRRILDQMPRVTRLNNRQESLGLTVEVRYN